jgi:cellulose synthase (UDP-forming)
VTPRAAERGGESGSPSERVVAGSSVVGWWLIAVAWTAVAADFWIWWLGQAHAGTPYLFWPQTVALLYLTTILPTFFFSYLRGMRQPAPRPPDPGLRVAMITLCVPSHESLEVIRAQLEALALVAYPHDSWVLDEGASADVRAVAEELGVRYFTRHGSTRWNQPGPPFQRSTKAGNVNAWLDYAGRAALDYDVFVQLDIDHNPSPEYLDRVLGYFEDPAVAWVQTPSVCGNLDRWTARGLAEQDMLFQGPLQMGFFGATGTPFIIGSHTAYRTSAIREIGGFQPTRAEDHLDTVVLAAHGYRGVFVPRVIARGAGPDDFATYLRQQFAWAHSMIGIFLRHTPRLLRRYTLRQAVQFLTCQSWYLLWASSFGVLWLIPTIALLLQRPVAEVSLPAFLLHFLPVPLMATIMWFWARRWFQPADVTLSWRGILLEIARWPVVLWALVNVVLGVRRPYMITPKGARSTTRVRLRALYGPYMVLPAVPLAALWVYVLSGATPLHGYYGLALFNAVWGVVLVVTTLLLEFRAVGRSSEGRAEAARVRMGILVTVSSLVGAFGMSVAVAWQSVLDTLT